MWKKYIIKNDCWFRRNFFGDLIINERVANDLEPKDRNLSMVFQNYALYPHLSVEENILFGLKVRKVQKEERQKRLMEAVEMVGLKEYVKMKPANYQVDKDSVSRLLGRL